MAEFPELLILRHGQTEWNREGRMQGALDSPLTDLGREHAAQQRQILQRFDLNDWALLCSPQGRAQATAKIALQDHFRRLESDEDLVEIGVGDWSGKRRVDLVKDIPDDVELRDGPDGAIALYEYAPGGEGFSGLRARVRRVLNRVSLPTLIITHGITSRMMRAEMLGVSNEDIGELPGGQGVIYHMKNRTQTRLE